MSMREFTSAQHEVRKIQVTGGSTYTISLPKKWIKKAGLGKGSPLSLIHEKNGTLVLMPEGAKKISKRTEAIIKISIEEDMNTILRKIIATFLIGYNSISIRTKNHQIPSSQATIINNFARRLLVGTEIISDSKNEIMLKVLLSYPELKIQNALRRTSIIASSMHREGITALKELNKELAQDLIRMDDEVDRFSLYVVRLLKAAVQDEKIIHEIGLSTGQDCLGFRLVTKAIERIADHAVEIAKNILLLKKPLEANLSKSIETMSTSATSVFNDSIDALFKRDYYLAETVVQKAKQISSLEIELLEAITKTADREEAFSLRLIIESIKRTAEYASDIAEIVLNMTINKIINE